MKANGKSTKRRTSITISPEVLERIDDYASMQDMSRSAAIEFILDAWLPTDQPATKAMSMGFAPAGTASTHV